MKPKTQKQPQKMEHGRWKKAPPVAVFAILHFLSSILVCAYAQTPVFFPLNQMFGGSPYTKSFTLQSAQNWITDGTNAWVGSSITVTPTGGTNPVVFLTPNTYLVTFPDATYPWRIAVPNTTNELNAIALSTGPLPTFLVQPYTPIIGRTGIIITNITGTNIASIDPGVVMTNGQIPLQFLRTTTLNASWKFNLYTFGVGTGTNNGMWMYSSAITPTNGYLLTTQTPNFSATNGTFQTMRDTYVLKYVDNNGNVTYILTAAILSSPGATNYLPGPLLATSPDGWNWTQRGFVNLYTNNACGTNLGYVWSPKLSINATNGLVATVGIGPLGGNFPTNTFMYDVNPTNLFQWTNYRWINTPSGTASYPVGMLYYTNGVYFYFSGNGDEITNSALTQNGWGIVAGNTASNAGGYWSDAGPSLAFYGGFYYWFQTDGGLCQVIASPDLVNWTPNVFTNYPPVLVTDVSSNRISTSEGSVVIEQYATPPPLYPFNGAFTGNGSGLTNLNAAQLVSGLGFNGLEVVITNTTGPHGWTNYYGSGILTNRINW